MLCGCQCALLPSASIAALFPTSVAIGRRSTECYREKQANEGLLVIAKKSGDLLLAAAFPENDAMSLSRAFMILMLGIAAPSFLVAHTLQVHAQDDGGDSGGDDGGSDDSGGDDSGGDDSGGDDADASATADDPDAEYIIDANGKRVKKPKTVDFTTLGVGDPSTDLNSHAILRRPSRG